jgi:acetoacetate decarboxylase
VELFEVFPEFFPLMMAYVRYWQSIFGIGEAFSGLAKHFRYWRSIFGTGRIFRCKWNFLRRKRMGFMRTQDEMDTYYGRAVRKFPGATMMGLMYETEPKIVARLLPPPLEPAEPWALSYIAHFPDTNLGPGYRESALFLRCKYRDEVGNYCLSMPLDGAEDRMHNGRDIYGFPKKLASIRMTREGDKVEGWVERQEKRFVTLSADLMVKLDEPPLKVGPSFLFKYMPASNLRPGFDGPVLLVRQKTEIEYRSFEMGSGTIVFEDSPHDPWSEIKCVQVIGAYYFTGDTTMQPGEVVGEADPEAFLPYSFHRTDWGFVQ